MTNPLQYLEASALSLTLSGNTGVAPFLTLFLVGIIEKYDPTLLQMEGWIEKIVASWPAIAVFGVLTSMEFVGKCVPVVDEIVESAMTFVVPVFSVLGSMSSWGLFTAPSPSSGGDDYVAVGRRLEDGGTNGLLLVLQVVLALWGIGVALLVHLCRMLVRLMGEGCCTGCITVLEESWIILSVTICIFIAPVAIVAAVLLLVAAGFGLWHWLDKRRRRREEEVAAAEAAGGGASEGQEQPGGGREEGRQGASVDNYVGPGINPDYVEDANATVEGTSKDDIRQPLLP